MILGPEALRQCWKLKAKSYVVRTLGSKQCCSTESLHQLQLVHAGTGFRCSRGFMLLRWLANIPAINRMSSMQWLPRKFGNLIGLQLEYMAHVFFAPVSRAYLQTKLLYSWWSFVGLRTGAFSLALFCISLASFLQDTQSKRRRCFQHGPAFPVKWMFIPWKKTERLPPTKPTYPTNENRKLIFWTVLLDGIY